MVSSFLLSAALSLPPKLLKNESGANFSSPVLGDTRFTKEVDRRLPQLLSLSPEQDEILAKSIRSDLYLFVNQLPEQIVLPEVSTSDEQMQQIGLKQSALLTLITYLPLKGPGIEAKMSTDVKNTFFTRILNGEGTRAIEAEDANADRFIVKAKLVNRALDEALQTVKIYHGENKLKDFLQKLEDKGLLTSEQKKIIDTVLERPYSPRVNTSNK